MIKPLIAALVLLASPVAAQTQCIDTPSAYAYMESKQAVRVFMGTFPQGVMEIWAEHDEDGPSWVAFITMPDGQSCLLTEGTVFIADKLPPNV